MAEDSNTVERAVRAVASSRKNYLFVGSDTGRERGAAIYNLVSSAGLNHLNPQVYWINILVRIAEHPVNRIDELLPWDVSLTPMEISEAA